MTQEQKREYAKLLKEIKSLPEAERRQMHAFAMGLVAATQLKQTKTA